MSPWLVPEESIQVESDSLSGWQVKLRRVHMWVLEHGDNAWQDAGLKSLSAELRANIRLLCSRNPNVTVEEIHAVYDRAISLGYPGPIEFEEF